MDKEKEISKDDKLNQAIDALVEEHLEKSKSEDEVEKAMPAALDENGGKDKMKSGSPYTEKGDVKVTSSDESHSKSEKKKMKKAEEEESEDKVEKSVEGFKISDEMKKAIEELGTLDEEEIELIKCWREEKAKEAEEIEKAQTVQHSAEDLRKSISEAVNAAVEPLKKALEDERELNKSLSDKIEKLASQPAYDKRSLSSLETIEKGGAEEPTISKHQVTDKMLQLQLEGKGVTSRHIAEFEGTGDISDPQVKKLVMDSFK